MILFNERIYNIVYLISIKTNFFLLVFYYDASIKFLNIKSKLILEKKE